MIPKPRLEMIQKLEVSCYIFQQLLCLSEFCRRYKVAANTEVSECTTATELFSYKKFVTNSHQYVKSQKNYKCCNGCPIPLTSHPLATILRNLHRIASQHRVHH